MCWQKYLDMCKQAYLLTYYLSGNSDQYKVIYYWKEQRTYYFTVELSPG